MNVALSLDLYRSLISRILSEPNCHCVKIERLGWQKAIVLLRYSDGVGAVISLYGGQFWMTSLQLAVKAKLLVSHCQRVLERDGDVAEGRVVADLQAVEVQSSAVF